MKFIKKILVKLLFILTLLSALLLVISYFSYIIPPSFSTIFSFIGLIYPLIIISNLFLLFFYLFNKNKIFIIPLLILLAGMYHNSRFIQLSIFNKKPTEIKFKVMSYNVRLFDLYNWTNNEKTRDEIIEQIQDVNPDIICFQEYYYDANNIFITRDLIIDKLKMPYYYENFTSQTRNTSFYGLAIFSKFPIINSSKILFNNDKSNSSIWSDIKIHKDTFRIYNAHIGSIRFNYSDYNLIGGKGSPLWDNQQKPKQEILKRLNLAFNKRNEQINTIIPQILRSPYEYVICSDINDTPISYAYHNFDKYFTDAFCISGNGIGGTYIGNLPGLRIDYIWHSRNLNSYSFTTHKEELSDHRAISTSIY